MLEALEYYQSLAEKFQSQLLTVPGILVVLAGLCVWLAGLRWAECSEPLQGQQLQEQAFLLSVIILPVWF